MLAVLVAAGDELPEQCRGAELRFGAWAASRLEEEPWLRESRYAHVEASPTASLNNVVSLWGRFGLLNNRLRCLANAIGYARRARATLVLTGPWEMFADAVLDVDWLTSLFDVVVAPSFPIAANTTLSCTDAFMCGGPCRGDALRAGGQRANLRSRDLYTRDPEPALCGYAAIRPRVAIRLEAAKFATTASIDRAIGYHQRLETTVDREPVAKMCTACATRIATRYAHVSRYYRKVCDGSLRHADLPHPVFLASDRFNRSTFDAWRLDGAIVYTASERSFVPDATFTNAPSAMFRSKLGAALYSSRFVGGPRARREALANEVQPVLVDMLLLAATAHFYPTPGSTMSQTVCFWRKAHGHPHPIQALRSCEEIVVVP